MRTISVREAVWVNTDLERVWQLCESLDDWPSWGGPILSAHWGRAPGWHTGQRVALTAAAGRGGTQALGRARAGGTHSGSLQRVKSAWPAGLSWQVGGRVVHVEPLRELRWHGGLRSLRGEFGLRLDPDGRGTQVEFSACFDGLAAHLVEASPVRRWLSGVQKGFLMALRRAGERVVGQIS